MGWLDFIFGIKTSGNFKYDHYQNKIRICEYIGTEKTVIIPRTIEQLPVICIGDKAFKNRTSIKSIIVPDSVYKIGRADSSVHMT